MNMKQVHCGIAGMVHLLITGRFYRLSLPTAFMRNATVYSCYPGLAAYGHHDRHRLHSLLLDAASKMRRRTVGQSQGPHASLTGLAPTGDRETEEAGKSAACSR